MVEYSTIEFTIGNIKCCCNVVGHLNPQSGRPGLPPLFVQYAATTTQQQTAGCLLGCLSIKALIIQAKDKHWKWKNCTQFALPLMMCMFCSCQCHDNSLQPQSLCLSPSGTSKPIKPSRSVWISNYARNAAMNGISGKQVPSRHTFEFLKSSLSKEWTRQLNWNLKVWGLISTASHVQMFWADFSFQTTLSTQKWWVPGGIVRLAQSACTFVRSVQRSLLRHIRNSSLQICVSVSLKLYLHLFTH